jgi:hypothetical protein
MSRNRPPAQRYRTIPVVKRIERIRLYPTIKQMERLTFALDVTRELCNAASRVADCALVCCEYKTPEPIRASIAMRWRLSP